MVILSPREGLAQEVEAKQENERFELDLRE